MTCAEFSILRLYFTASLMVGFPSKTSGT